MYARDDVSTDMEFNPEEIKEFQDIIKAEYGVELSEDDATVMAKRLMSLYELISLRLPDELGPERQPYAKPDWG